MEQASSSRSQAMETGNKDEATIAHQLLEIVEDRSFKTYQSRLKASQRLRFRHHAWNASLISTATATLIASIALITDNSIYGNAGPTLLVCVSALTLVASLVASGLNYAARSRDMFLNYRRVQRLSAEVERAKHSPDKHMLTTVAELNREYDALLDESENHTEADYKRAFAKGWRSRSVWAESVLSALPYLALVVPVALAVPLIRWLLSS